MYGGPLTIDTEKRTVLIIDDDPHLGATLKDALATPDVAVVHVKTGGEGLEVCRNNNVHVVLLDQKLPDVMGDSLCHPILELNDHTKIVLMTAYPSYKSAVAALKAGAYDYLCKPFEIAELKLALVNAFRVDELERIEQLHTRQRQHEIDQSVLVGEFSGLKDAAGLARLAANADAPVLLSGETGTGKSLMARFIHYNGVRRKSPFVSLNCATLPESLAESELFGHEKGAFTGASGMRRGIFEMAEGGTVFLDEIGSMQLHLQAKLLGVLEDRRIRRVGGESERTVNARIIAASNSNLKAAVEEGNFRQDLYFRINVMTIVVPPLRRRRQDIPELCAFLFRSLRGRNWVLSEDELDRLMQYDWPGNVRELRNVLERAVIVQNEEVLQPSQFLSAVDSRERSGMQSEGRVHPSPGILRLDEVERDHIEATLRRLDFNLTRTAKTLGVALSTLKRKLDRFGIHRSAKR